MIAIDCGPSLSGEWYKLTPDITGSYVNGTWTEIATLPVFYNVDRWVEIQYSPLNFASAVLPDGRVIVMGGESNGPDDGLPVGAIYDPVANTWTPVSAPPEPGGYSIHWPSVTPRARCWLTAHSCSPPVAPTIRISMPCLTPRT